MKRAGILHAELARHLALLGHTDLFAVVDSGFPVPPDVPLVDLRVVFGLPAFAPVLDAALHEVVVEQAFAAAEAAEANPSLLDGLTATLGAHGAPLELLPHADLKQAARAARFAVRTAEDTPYGNVVLRAGVAFL